jgi:hypothetical protein
MGTFPKPKVAGLTASWPAATALPDTARSISPALAALIFMAILPAGWPAACGVKAIVSITLWPGVIVNGTAGVTTWNDPSDDAALAMVTDAGEPLVRASVSCCVLPTTAVPKFRFTLAAETILIGFEVDVPPKSPWQPAIPMTASSREKRPA